MQTIWMVLKMDKNKGSKHLEDLKNTINIFNEISDGVSKSTPIIINGIISDFHKLFSVAVDKEKQNNILPPLLLNVFLLNSNRYELIIAWYHNNIAFFSLNNNIQRSEIIEIMIAWDFLVFDYLDKGFILNFNDIKSIMLETSLLSSSYMKNKYSKNIKIVGEEKPYFDEYKKSNGYTFEIKMKNKIAKAYKKLGFDRGKFLLEISKNNCDIDYKEISKNSKNEATLNIDKNLKNIKINLDNVNIKHKEVSEAVEELKKYDDNILSAKGAIAQININNHPLSFLNKDTLKITNDNKLIFERYTKGLEIGYISQEVLRALKNPYHIQQIENDIDTFRRNDMKTEMNFNKMLLKFIQQSKPNAKHIPFKAIAFKMKIPLEEVMNYANNFIGVSKKSFLNKSFQNIFILQNNKTDSELDDIKIISSIETYKKAHKK